MAVVTVMAVSLSGCLRDIIFRYGHYDREIERFYDTENELAAIEAAENINYTFYTNLSRWEGSWANFIDKEVIDHYNESYNDARENKEEADIYFEYYAWADHHQRLDFKIMRDEWEMVVRVNGEDLFKDQSDRDINYYNDNDEMFLGHTENGTWVIDKNSSRAGADPGEDVDLYLHFEDCFLVKMYLSYDDIWGPLAAIFVETIQFLVLDIDLDVLMIGVHPSPMIMS